MFVTHTIWKNASFKNLILASHPSQPLFQHTYFRNETSKGIIWQELEIHLSHLTIATYIFSKINTLFQICWGDLTIQPSQPALTTHIF